MKNSPLTTVLLVLVTLSALTSVAFCFLYISNARELRSLQAQVITIQNSRAAVASLANDAIEYSKKNQAIDPILESAGIKPKAGAQSTNRPPTSK